MTYRDVGPRLALLLRAALAAAILAPAVPGRLLGQAAQPPAPQARATEIFDNYFANASGTSMSTALTSGAAALLKALQPDLTPGELVDGLKRTAVRLAEAPEWRVGAGAINAARAVEFIRSDKRRRG